MTIQYGYIIDVSIFRKQLNDVAWTFTRTDENNNVVNFNGIKTTRDLEGDSNVVIIGNNQEFNSWLTEN